MRWVWIWSQSRNSPRSSGHCPPGPPGSGGFFAYLVGFRMHAHCRAYSGAGGWRIIPQLSPAQPYLIVHSGVSPSAHHRGHWRFDTSAEKVSLTSRLATEGNNLQKLELPPEAGVCAETRWLQPRGMALLYIVFCNLHIASCNLYKHDPVGADAPPLTPPLPERGGFRKGGSRGAELGSQLGEQSPNLEASPLTNGDGDGCAGRER